MGVQGYSDDTESTWDSGGKNAGGRSAHCHSPTPYSDSDDRGDGDAPSYSTKQYFMLGCTLYSGGAGVRDDYGKVSDCCVLKLAGLGPGAQLLLSQGIGSAHCALAAARLWWVVCDMCSAQ